MSKSIHISAAIIGVALIIGGIFIFHNGPGQAGAAEVKLGGFAWSENIGWISFSCGSALGGAPQTYSVAYDSGSGDLSGQAWSSNVGWIKFAGTAVDSTSYGVNINGSGEFSGTAWSENIGWISFDRPQTGNPPEAPLNGGSGPIASYDSVSGEITGWARACGGTDGPADCTSQTNHPDGWDGWIKLSSLPNYGVSIGETNTLDGFAWGAEVVGWVSFGGEACAGGSYGVTYDTVTQQFGGNAWSENIGWISFDYTETGLPPEAPYNAVGATTTARYVYDEDNPLTNQDRLLTGWARALNGLDDPGDGYDGWIKLSDGTETAPEPIWGGGATRNAAHMIFNGATTSCELAGWAWGGEVIGWISLNTVTDTATAIPYGVTFNSDFCNLPPVITEVAYLDTNFCANNALDWNYQIQWNVVDLFDNPPQEAAQMAFYTDEFDPDNSTVFVSNDPTQQTGTSVIWFSAAGGTDLGFGQTYFWRVRAQDALGKWSDWGYDLSNPTVSTPAGLLPASQFTYLPANPADGEIVQFDSSTTDFHGATSPSYSWSLENGTPSSASDPNPISYFPTGLHNVVLTAGSEFGSCDSTEGPVNVSTQVPQIIEVTPRVETP